MKFVIQTSMLAAAIAFAGAAQADELRRAEEYLQMIRDHGFQVAPESVSYPYLCSRSDLGLLERLLRIPPPKPGARDALAGERAVRT